MQLSTKSRYAVRAMVELALHYNNGSLQLKEIARRQEISEKYLEQIFNVLRTEGYITSRKGSRGGYQLARPPHEITIYDLVKTMEGSIGLAPCLHDTEDCTRKDLCVTRDVWDSLNNIITTHLQTYTLADLTDSAVP